MEETVNKDYRASVEKALINAGANKQDFQVRELTPTNNLRLILGKVMDKKGHPFYNMPLNTNKKDITYRYENNPRIVWIINALEKAHVKIKQTQLQL